MATEVITCPNCNVDVDVPDLRRNHLLCPTCGQDLSDSAELQAWSQREQDGDEDADEKK